MRVDLDGTNLLPGDSSEADDLHQGSGQVEQHIPQTVHCLPQDARLRKKTLITELNATGHDLTSTPVVPSLRVTLVRDIA